MVAITVILASIVGTYTLDMANKVDNKPPNAVFSFEQESKTYNNNRLLNKEYTTVNVVYEAGPQLDLDNINITMNAGSAAWESGPLFATYDPDNPWAHNGVYPATMKEMVTKDNVEQYARWEVPIILSKLIGVPRIRPRNS
jgi:FlaG/FlaF family flagellin (archaellin)